MQNGPPEYERIQSLIGQGQNVTCTGTNRENICLFEGKGGTQREGETLDTQQVRETFGFVSAKYYIW